LTSKNLFLVSLSLCGLKLRSRVQKVKTVVYL
jgi:hypothetical protein